MIGRDQSSETAELVALVREGHTAAFVARAHDIDAVDLADVLLALDEDERIALIQLLPVEVSSHALAEMSETASAGDVLAAVDPELAAEIVDELDDDDAADLLGELSADTQERILDEVEDRRPIDQLLSYHHESAGGVMTTHMITVTDVDRIGLALEAVRRQSEDFDDVTEIFVVDNARRLVGTLSFKRLVLSAPSEMVRDVMHDADVRVVPETDQEEVARLMARYNVPSVPVVDAADRLIGRITYDDVIDVAEAEATEDLLRFGGVSPDEGMSDDWSVSVRSRLPWLYLNTLTAFLGAAVVMTFEQTIARLTVLAIWMPIVAGLGGNTGTQALAVTVRRLSLGQLSPARARATILREVAVGITNGIAIGMVLGLVAVLLGESWRLGAVIFSAMTLNLMVAGFAGAAVPAVLKRMGADPAVASSMFITALTDVCGFGLLLGLATLVLL